MPIIKQRVSGENHMQRRKPKRGFTLVELLVVIGIIALLISILLPALNKARQSAKKIACLANLKSLGNAFVMYSGANKGWWPYPTSTQASNTQNGSNAYGGTPIWYDAIDPYLGSKVGVNRQNTANNRSYTAYKQDPVWQEFPEKYNNPVNQGLIKEANRTYKMNSHLRASKTGRNSGTGLPDVGPINQSFIKESWKLVVVGDSAGYDVYPFDSSQNATAGRFSMQMSDNIDDANPWLYLRHNDTANIVFADGHAENCKFKLTPRGTGGDGTTPLKPDSQNLPPNFAQNYRFWYSEYVNNSSGQPVWPYSKIRDKTLDSLGYGRNPEMPIQWSQPPRIAQN